MQVQRIQNNGYNPHFRAMNIDIKLKMSDIDDFLQKKFPDSNIKSGDLKNLFDKANKNKKNDEKVAILTGNEIYEFFEMAWTKLKEKSFDVHMELQSFVQAKRTEMWRSVERDFTPEDKEKMKNLIKLQKQYSKDKAKCVNKITKLKQSESDKVTPEQIQKAEDEFNAAVKKYHDVTGEIEELKYDKSKLDTTKYVDLGDK